MMSVTQFGSEIVNIGDSTCTSVYDIKIDVKSIRLETDPGKAIVTFSRTLSNVSYSNSQLYDGSGGSDYSGIYVPVVPKSRVLVVGGIDRLTD